MAHYTLESVYHLVQYLGPEWRFFLVTSCDPEHLAQPICLSRKGRPVVLVTVVRIFARVPQRVMHHFVQQCGVPALGRTVPARA